MYNLLNNMFLFPLNYELSRKVSYERKKLCIVSCYYRGGLLYKIDEFSVMPEA